MKAVIILTVLTALPLVLCFLFLVSNYNIYFFRFVFYPDAKD